MSGVAGGPASREGTAAPRDGVAAGEASAALPAAMSGTRAPGEAAGRRPDFFIVGHQKCGTTALYMMLQDHPQIFMPEEKEPRFFIPELRPPPRRDGKKRKRPATVEEYLALFEDAGPDQRAGEASPQYLRYPEVPAAIAELQPQARIIALLREPASFLRSFHGQMLHNRVETEKDFERAMGLQRARSEGRSLPRGCVRPGWLQYSDHVRYTQQLQSFYDVFPAEQILVLIYEDYRRDNEAVVREVLRFLEVDDSRPVQQLNTKPLKDVRVERLHRLTGALQEARRNPAAAGPALRTINRLMPDALRGEAVSTRWRQLVYRSRVEPRPEFMRELRVRFRPEVEQVSEYLGRDLVALWGYDRL